MVTTIATATAKAMDVKDIAKQCPGDKFSMVCSDPNATYMKYDEKTGLASATAPKLINEGAVNTCTFIQTSVSDGVVCPLGTFPYHKGSHCCKENKDYQSKPITYNGV